MAGEITWAAKPFENMKGWYWSVPATIQARARTTRIVLTFRPRRRSQERLDPRAPRLGCCGPGAAE
jgi:hypothetical protein